MESDTMTTDRYAFTNVSEMGTVCAPDKGVIALDVWRRVIDLNTRQETGNVKRERMRTLREVYRDLHDALDVLVCDKCGHERKRRDRHDYCAKCEQPGCDGEYESLIDEYFSGPDIAPDGGSCGDGLVPHNFRWIACWAVTGGNEGHYVHVDFMVPVEKVKTYGDGDFGAAKLVTPLRTENLWRPVRLALG
jgi:hypothetical protein